MLTSSISASNAAFAFGWLSTAALAPLGEVLFADRFAIKLGCEHDNHRWKRIEPCREGFALFAVLQAAVELFADHAGKPGDFSVSWFIHWSD